jgi:5-methylcytosine-specific restriction protein A
MLAAARNIRSALMSHDSELLAEIRSEAVDEHTVSAVEGRILERLHRYRERNPQLRKAKVQAALNAVGRLACEACEFDFAQRFGAHGKGYIEVHHRRPLHEAGEDVSNLDDLALLCANCHRMSHRRLDRTGTWPSVQELRALLDSH